MAQKTAYLEPPYKAAMVDPQQRLVTLTWLQWFQQVARLGRIYQVDGTFDPPPLGAGATAGATVTVAGARVGDFAQVSFDQPNSGIVWWASVTADNTVTVVYWNRTGGSIDLGSGTLRVKVEVKL